MNMLVPPLALLMGFSISFSVFLINNKAAEIRENKNEVKTNEVKTNKESNYNLKVYAIDSKEKSTPKFKIIKSKDIIVSEKDKKLTNAYIKTNKEFETTYNFVEYVKSINDKLEKETGLIEEGFKIKLVKLDSSNYKVFISQNVINGLEHFTFHDLKIDLPIQTQFDFNTDFKIDSGETMVIDSPSYKSDDGYLQNQYIITIH